MPNTSNPTRVVVIGPPGSTQQQVTAALSSASEFELVDFYSPHDENLVMELRDAKPGLILIEYSKESIANLDLIDELVDQFPEATLVTILPSEDPTTAQQVMLAGASAFVLQPFTQVNLLSTLRRVVDLQSRRQRAQAVTVPKEHDRIDGPLHTLAVFSPRGGVGVSTLALNLALTLFEETGANVLLVEGKLLFGHLGVMLNIRTRNSIADLIPHASNLDEQLIRDVINKHATGFSVLLAPIDVQLAQGIRPQDLYNVLTNLERLYDFLVIDAGSHLDENTVTFLDSADQILLVTSPEMASLHDASRFLQISQSLAYPADKIKVVLNRAGMQGGIKPKDIEIALHNPIFAQIPEDISGALRSLNRGLPLVYRYPRSKASREIKKLGRVLGGTGKPEKIDRLKKARTSIRRQDAVTTVLPISESVEKK
jgi:pilus assembly protein CpaE